MAVRVIREDDDTGTPDTGVSSPGDSGGGTFIPPTVPLNPGTKIATIIAGTSLVLTPQQIIDAGGPWPDYKVKVTALNRWGASAPAVISSYELLIDGGVLTVDGSSVEF